MRSSGQSSLFGGGSGSASSETGSSIQEEPGIILNAGDASPEEKASWSGSTWALPCPIIP